MIRIPFHMVEASPWPICGSIGAFALTSGITSWMHQAGGSLLCLGVVLVIFTMVQWWRDVNRESTFGGYHCLAVTSTLRFGVILFIVSEVCFFFAFFWAYFHSSLSPTWEIGSVWPPTGIHPLNPFSVPLLNTVVLLASGGSVTWAHHALITGKWSESVYGLVMTVGLGGYFTLLQLHEYAETSFSMSDSSYGSVFFVATGFHGAHVIIGSVFLFVCLLRNFFYYMSPSHHAGLEAAAWYWHFVDVVWIFLYVFIYWWGYS